MSEYFIKQPNTDHTRGPLSLEQLTSLGDTGGVTPDTLLYDEITEKWKPLAAYPELTAIVFPPKKSLKLNRKEINPTEEKVANEIAEGKLKPKVSTEKILAAAHGETRQTRHIGRAIRSREQAAGVMIPGIGAALLVGGVALIYPIKNLIFAAADGDPVTLAQMFHPFSLIGVVYLLLSGAVFLGVTSVFPIVRLIAAITVGVSGYLFWAWGNEYLLAAGCGLGLGLFFATISLRYGPMLLSLSIAIAGGALLAYASIGDFLIY
jgi:hypothetical protein